jgi:hypothetical protein
MKDPSTSLAQHTSRASLVYAEKNHVGYFLNRPRKHGKEPSGSVEVGELLEWRRKYYF